MFIYFLTVKWCKRKYLLLLCLQYIHVRIKNKHGMQGCQEDCHQQCWEINMANFLACACVALFVHMRFLLGDTFKIIIIYHQLDDDLHSIVDLKEAYFAGNLIKYILSSWIWSSCVSQEPNGVLPFCHSNSLYSLVRSFLNYCSKYVSKLMWDQVKKNSLTCATCIEGGSWASNFQIVR